MEDKTPRPPLSHSSSFTLILYLSLIDNNSFLVLQKLKFNDQVRIAARNLTMTTSASAAKQAEPEITVIPAITIAELSVPKSVVEEPVANQSVDAQPAVDGHIAADEAIEADVCTLIISYDLWTSIMCPIPSPSDSSASHRHLLRVMRCPVVYN